VIISQNKYLLINTLQFGFNDLINLFCSHISAIQNRFQFSQLCISKCPVFKAACVDIDI